jgi:hypothetical protein
MQNNFIDKLELNDAILKSGFPFQLSIANKLIDFGFKVQPSYQFFDISRGRDVELDIVAIYQQEFKTTNGEKILGILRIGIECKDNSLPFVCFGLKHSEENIQGFLDNDSFYCHLVTTKDKGMPNKFAIPIFEQNHSKLKAKKYHHQFDESLRFHFATAIEKKGKNSQKFLKLHIPDNLNYTLGKLGAFIGNFHGYGSSAGLSNSLLEEAYGLPVIDICFLALVHSGNHFQYILGDTEPKESYHTSVFLNRSYINWSVNYIVDFVAEETLLKATQKIISSFEIMIKQIAPYILAS